MALPYTETTEQVLDTYRRVHANGEQTHVAILSVGDSRFAAVAYDVDPADMVPVAAEAVAYDPTLDGARERARRWMEQHPRGVADDGDGGGWGQKINRWALKAMKKLDDYGNQQVEQMSEQQGGRP